jgi:hypothetical protein
MRTGTGTETGKSNNTAGIALCPILFSPLNQAMDMTVLSCTILRYHTSTSMEAATPSTRNERSQATTTWSTRPTPVMVSAH